MFAQSSSIKLEQALLRGYKNLRDLAEYLLTTGVEAVLALGTRVGYLDLEDAEEEGTAPLTVSRFPSFHVNTERVEAVSYTHLTLPTIA